MKKEILSNVLIAAAMILTLVNHLQSNNPFGWQGWAATILIIIAGYRIIKGYLE